MIAFEQSLPMRLYRLLDMIMPAYRALFAEHDLTEQQWRLLRVVWERERVTAQDAAAATLLSPQSLVGIVDRLSAKGLVTRLRSVDDRRVVYLLPTAEGRALGETILPHVLAIHEQTRATLDDDEWTTLNGLFDKIQDEFLEERTNARDTQAVSRRRTEGRLIGRRRS
ncbi:MAG: MarR family transcriptional regulator [Pseudomonadota bacterium]